MARRKMRPPAMLYARTATAIAPSAITDAESSPPSRNQSLRRMPPRSFRMTATQNTGREKNTNVKNVTM